MTDNRETVSDERQSPPAASSHAERGNEAHRGRALSIVACLAILAVAGAVRVCGAFNELWLDEIWSLNLAGQVATPLEIFTKIHHDNNHYLNTLYLYFLGRGASEFVYRIPSLLAGIATVVAAGLIGRRRGTTDAIFAMLVVGFSYVLILYSSEARGYAAAVFFAFLCFYLLDRYLETRRWPLALMFSLCAVLGLLSHLTFVCFYSSALVWSGYRLMKSRLGPSRTATALLSCHAVPILFLATLYFADVRHIVVGGGTPLTLLAGYGTALAWALGTPAADFMIILTCIAAVVILDVGLRMSGARRLICSCSSPALL